MTTTDQSLLKNVTGLSQGDFSNAARRVANDPAQAYDDGMGWLKSALPDSVADYADEAVVGGIAGAFGLAVGGPQMGVIIGGLALAAKSYFLDDDPEMAQTYLAGALAGGVLGGDSILMSGGAAIAGALLNHNFAPQILPGANQVGVTPEPVISRL